MSVDEVNRFLEPFTKGANGYIALTKATRITDTDDVEVNKRWEGHTLSNLYCEVTNGDFALPRDIMESNDDAEWYYAPAVFSEEYRRESKFVQANALWVDFDEPVDWENLSPQPSIVVQTSAIGKVHAYWMLDDPITEVAEIRYWNKRILEGYGEGADPSGYDAAQLLKLPYGRNLKLANRDGYGNFFEPKILKFEPQESFATTAFEHLPEPTAPGLVVDLSEIGDVPGTSEGDWEHYAALYSVDDKTMLKIFRPGDDRSDSLYSVEATLLDADLEPEHVYQILYRSPNDKFSQDFGPNRGAERLWQDVCRVSKKLEHKKSQRGVTAEIQDILNGKASFREKGVEVAALVEETLEGTGRFIQTEENESYYVDERMEAPRLYRVESTATSQFAGFVAKRFGILPGIDAKMLTAVLHHAVYQCHTKTKVPFHYFAHYDAESNRVYVDRHDGTMYVLDGETVTKVPQGFHNVWFAGGTGEAFPKTFDYTSEYKKGGLDALVLTGPNYDARTKGITSKHLKHILLTWVSTFFFPEMMNTRPIVLFHGEADSGKSTFFQNLSLIFSGDPTYAVIGMPKDTKDFNVQVCKNSYIFYDNVEVNKQDMQEQLAKVATGFSVRDRKLHSNSDQSIMNARAFVGLTSRTVDRIQKDVAQRYIVISLFPYQIDETHRRKPMSQIRQEVRDLRNDLFSELLDHVNRIVRQISKNGLATPTSETITMRMADYALFLHLTADMVGLSGPSMEKFILQQQANTVNENDVLYSVLKEFAQQTPVDKKWGLRELYAHLCTFDRKFLKQYGSQSKFSAALRSSTNNGSAQLQGLAVKEVKSGGSTKYRVFYNSAQDGSASE